MACGGIVRGNHDISVELDEPTTLVQIANVNSYPSIVRCVEFITIAYTW
jgi:predicted neuraminidase